MLFKRFFRVIPFTILFFFSYQISASTAPTAEKLYKGLKIPLKRNFPLDPQTPPCQDFYTHVCGPVVQSFKLPSEHSNWVFSFTDIREKILHVRNAYLQNLKNFSPASERGRALKDFYMSCINEKAGATDQQKHVESFKKQVLSLKNRDEFIKHITSQVAQGTFNFIGFGSTGSQDNPNEWSSIIYSDTTTLPEKSYYEKTENLNELKKYALEFFKALKLDQPEKRADRVVAFEKSYAQADLSPAEYRTRFGTKNEISREKALQKFPHLHLDKIFSLFPSESKIRIIAPEPLSFMNNAYKNYDLEALKDAYLFHIARKYMRDAFPEFHKVFWAFNHKVLGGPEKERPRNIRCAEHIDHRFGKELDAELIPILYKDFPEEKVRVLAEKIRTSLLEQIDENTWLTPFARKEAYAKTEKAKLFLVKPQNDKEWDFNPLLKYNPETPVANNLALSKALVDKELFEMKSPRNRDVWYMSPLAVNAYYVSQDNKFTLLQGILGGPFFNPTASEIENIGAIGSIVGHELGHGIDDEGSKYDSDGKFRQWMKEKDLKEFKIRGDKFVESFNQIGHDGKLTLGENIGDQVGIRTAYRAAFPSNKGSLDDKKKFFYSYARMWCNKMLPKYEERILKTNPHALGYARVNQQVNNLDGFYEAFSCKAGDKMYREEKDRLKLW